MSVNFLSVLIVAATIQGALLVLFLLASKHKDKTANYLLSGLIVLFTYYALVKILSNTSEILNFPHLIRTYRPVFVLACATTYFYCEALTNPAFRFKWRDSIHLIPLGVYSLAMLPFFLSGAEIKIASLSYQPFTFSWIIERSFFVIVFLFYFGLSLRTVRRHQRRIKDIFSNLEKIKLDWLRNLLLVFSAIWLAALFRFLTAYGNVGYENKYAVPVLLCLTIYLIAWYALRQPELFDDRWDRLTAEKGAAAANGTARDVKTGAEPPAAKQSAKYDNSSLCAPDIARYKEILVNYLKHEKPYTDPGLKLQDLAGYLGIPSYQVSQIINTELHQNFYDLINSHRIEEAKRMLADPAYRGVKILAVAYDVGFNSKSTFNAAFKKYVKKTPSQFRASGDSQLESVSGLKRAI